MDNVTIQDREVSVSEAGVLVKRDLTCKDEWLIGSVQIESIGTTSVLVHLVDEFPESLPVETAGFRRDQELDGGDITTERASIKKSVDGDQVTVDYGIKLSESVEEVTFGPPEIRDVESAELPRSGIAHTDGGNPSDVGADGGPDASVSASPHSPTDEPTDSRSGPGKGVQWGDEVASSAGVKKAIRKVDDGDREAESTQAADDRHDGPTATDESEPVPGPDGAEPPATAPPSERSEADGQNADGDEKAQATRRSVDARIDWLSARVDEFAAYTTALEELIDDHGTAPEFIERMEGNLDDLEGRLESVQADVDSIQEAHRTATEDLHRKTDDLDQRLDEARTTLEAELDDIDGRVSDEVERIDGRVSDEVERIDDDLADQRAVAETHTDEIDRLSEQVTGIGDELDEVRETVGAVDDQTAELSAEVHAMREDLRSIRSDVQELTEFRDSLSAFFDGHAESERSDEQQSGSDGT